MPPPKDLLLALIVSTSFIMWAFDLLSPGWSFSLALVMIAVVLVAPKVHWILMVKWPGEKKAASALAEHKIKHPEAY